MTTFTDMLTLVREAVAATTAEGTAKLDGAGGMINLAYFDFVRDSGIYVGEIDRIDEWVRITVDATGGTFTVTYAGQTTAALAWNITPAALQLALEALSNIAPGDVLVTGGVGQAGGETPYDIQFSGVLASINQSAVTTNAASLTGGAQAATVTVVREGGGPAVLTNNLPTYDLDTVTGKTDILRLLKLYITGGGNTRRELESVTPERMAELRSGDSAVGTPLSFCLQGRNHLVVWPPPATGYTLQGEYAKRPAAVSGATEFVKVPVEYHEGIMAKACARFMRYDGQPEAAIGWEQTYDVHVGRARQQLKVMAGTRRPAMRPSRQEHDAGQVSDQWSRMGLN